MIDTVWLTSVNLSRTPDTFGGGTGCGADAVPPRGAVGEVKAPALTHDIDNSDPALALHQDGGDLVSSARGQPDHAEVRLPRHVVDHTRPPTAAQPLEPLPSPGHGTDRGDRGSPRRTDRLPRGTASRDHNGRGCARNRGGTGCVQSRQRPTPTAVHEPSDVGRAS